LTAESTVARDGPTCAEATEAPSRSTTIDAINRKEAQAGMWIIV
jgi:hypothetical protein